MLEAIQRLSTATKGREDYLAIGDRAWQSAALSAEMKAADTGKREDILDTATNALKFQRAFDRGGEDHAKVMGALMAQLDIPKENQQQLEKLWPPRTENRTALERVIERRSEARDRGRTLERIVNTLMGSDERLIPAALKYNEYYKPEHDRDGAFERVSKLQATLDEINRIPESSMFSGLHDDDLQKARRAFRPPVKGPRHPSVGEFHYSFKDFTKSLSGAPAGKYLAWRPVAAGISRIVHRRVSADAPYSVSAFQEDVKDAASVLWNVASSSVKKERFKFVNNRFTRVGP